MYNLLFLTVSVVRKCILNHTVHLKVMVLDDMTALQMVLIRSFVQYKMVHLHGRMFRTYSFVVKSIFWM